MPRVSFSHPPHGVAQRGANWGLANGLEIHLAVYFVTHRICLTPYVILSGAKRSRTFGGEADKSARRSRSGIYIRLSGKKRENIGVHSPTVGGDPASAAPRALPRVGFDFTDITP